MELILIKDKKDSSSESQKEKKISYYNKPKVMVNRN